jgi:hypothetical protein
LLQDRLSGRLVGESASAHQFLGYEYRRSWPNMSAPIRRRCAASLRDLKNQLASGINQGRGAASRNNKGTLRESLYGAE